MKKILALVLVLSTCFLFASCTADSGKKKLALAANPIEVNHSDSQQDDYVEFLDKLDAFAAKLTYEIYSDSDKQSNVCISPVSVYMALALATECADGETRDEILNAVGVTYDEVKNFTKLLYSFCNQEFYYLSDVTEKKEVLAFEELVNSIWVDKRATLNEDGINNLANNYNCDLFSVNFKNGDGTKAINEYIEEKTHGIIDGDIELSPETLITLINTFYLKEVWNGMGGDLVFTEEAYDFKNADGSITNTKLLYGYYANGKIYEGDGYTSFYTRTNNGFDIKFIVPTDGHTLDEVFTTENIYTINNLGDYDYVDKENELAHVTRVIFPKYKASFDDDIAKILENDFGINDLFYLGECDFSNVTDEQIACDGVIHKCSIEVTEKGIEGAAVTVMATYGGEHVFDNYEKVYHDYIVDRAFGFVLTDSYGAVLFSGVVNSVN